MLAQVFQTPRKSIPDVASLSSSSNGAGDKDVQQHVLLFDSLKSLPTELPAALQGSDAHTPSSRDIEPLDPGVLEVIAGWLRSQLQLTLFGFDVVVASGSGDWLVIDVNYFPNFKASDGTDVAAGFRAALRGAWERYRRRM